MSLRVLELGTLHLTYSEHHLKLSVVSAADVRIPRSISSLDNDAFIKALTSRNLWVSRGVACHFDIQILFNGKPLDKNGRVNLLESLGYRLCDARLWSQLSLSASLDIWQNDDPAKIARDLSININHGMEPPIPQTRNRAWALDNFDMKPPESVLCAEFERMQVQFNFLDVREQAKPVKRVKADIGGFDIQEAMLLELAPESDTNGTTNELEHAVEGMKGLPGPMERFFESWPGSASHSAPLQQPPVSLDPDQDSDTPTSIQGTAEQLPGKENGNGSKSSVHPKETIEILKGWLEAHISNPYPSMSEKQELMRRTGLKLNQVNNWFQHHRRRLRKEALLTKDKMLSEQVEEGATLVENSGNQDDDDMLLSQAADDTPSLTSQSSIASSILSIEQRDSSLKRSSPGEEIISPDKTSASELGDVAIHILISGYIGRGSQSLGGVQVEKSPPSLSLASIAPVTFCPGFKESMAHNAHFVPTISRAASVSWPRNTQSPSLRQKLTQLENSPPSLTDENQDRGSEAGTTSRIAAVVQSRLWGMMQRKLYDSSDAAKIWRKSPLRENLTEDECPDLLETLGTGEREEGRVMIELGEFSEDEADEFEDLLSRDDDELLEYLEERERLSVERETDEMLFGGGWGEDEEEEQSESLLDNEAGSDIMLL